MKACPICQNTEISKEFTVTRDDLYIRCLPLQSQIQARYKECRQCYCHYLSVPNMDDSSYTDGAYYDVDAKDNSFFQKRFDKIVSLPRGQSDNLDRVQRIRDYVGKFNSKVKSSVLDVGAGLGIFLHQFLSENWHGTATELDSRLCEHMSSNLKNVEIKQGQLSEQKFSKSFDLITLNRVLEHVEFPARFLEDCRKLLEPSGFLYLELPDIQSFYLDNENNEAYGYGHYAVYSPEAICKVARDSGFEVNQMSRVKEPSTKYTIYAFLQPKKVGLSQ